MDRRRLRRLGGGTHARVQRDLQRSSFAAVQVENPDLEKDLCVGKIDLHMCGNPGFLYGGVDLRLERHLLRALGPVHGLALGVPGNETGLDLALMRAIGGLGECNIGSANHEVDGIAGRGS